jgi:hypothetical protein
MAKDENQNEKHATNQFFRSLLERDKTRGSHYVGPHIRREQSVPQTHACINL